MIHEGEPLIVDKKKSYFDLPPNSEIADLLSKIQAGEINLKVIDFGSYFDVFVAEDNSLVLKVLIDNVRQKMGLDRATERYGDKTSWIHENLVNKKFLETSDPRLLEDLLQLALQHEMHKKFLGDHIIPKQFVIVNLPGSIEDKHGNVIEAGEHVAEVQREFPTDNENCKVLAHGLFNYIDSGDSREVWSDDFVQEAVSLLNALVAMLKVGVSMDSTYTESGDVNCLIALENGEKRILIYDTNSWQSSVRYRDKLKTTFLGNETANDPYPGIDWSGSDYGLAEKVILPLLDRFKKVIDLGILSPHANELVKTTLARVFEDLRNRVDPEDSYEQVQQRNAPILEQIKLLNEPPSTERKSRRISLFGNRRSREQDTLKRNTLSEVVGLYKQLSNMGGIPLVVHKLEEILQ